MKTAFKAVLTTLGLALILMGVCAILVFTQMDRVSSSALEELLSGAFNGEVSIESAGIVPAVRGLEIRGFVLENPEAFKDGPALECERILVEFDLMTLLSRSPVIHAILLKGVDVHYRYQVGQGTNIGSLAKSAAAGGGPGRRFTVDSLRCEKAEVHFSTNLIPKSSLGLRVVTIDLAGMGKEDPVTAREMVSLFLRALMEETMTVKGLLSTAVKSMTNELKDLGGTIAGKK